MPYNGLTATYKAFLPGYKRTETKELRGLLNECPERKEGAAWLLNLMPFLGLFLG